MTEQPGVPITDGRYLILEALGSGGMAAVFRAWDRELDQACAVKVIHAEIAKKRSVRARFAREAEAMVRMDHPHVIQIIDLDLEAKQPFLVMEIAPGGSLDRWTELHGPMPVETVTAVMMQVCSGVMAAHAQGIVHRDLKPQNVLIDHNGSCRVSDFGIAQIHDAPQLTKTGHGMGTWLYMPPEQRLNAKDVDHRGDIFSLGVLTYALLIGADPPDLCLADKDPRILDAIDPRFRSLVQTATGFEPEDRYSSVAEMYAALEALTRSFTPGAEPLSLALPPMELDPLDVSDLHSLRGLLTEALPTNETFVAEENLPHTLPSYVDASALDPQDHEHQTGQTQTAPSSPAPPKEATGSTKRRVLLPLMGAVALLILVPLIALGLTLSIGTVNVQRAAVDAIEAEAALNKTLRSGIHEDLVHIGADPAPLEDAREAYQASADPGRFARYVSVLTQTGDPIVSASERNDADLLRVRTRLASVQEGLVRVNRHHRAWAEAQQSAPGTLAVTLGLAPPAPLDPP